MISTVNKIVKLNSEPKKIDGLIQIAIESKEKSNMYPIAFSHTNLDNNDKIEKEKDFGHCIPGNIKTYIFETIEDYYNDYIKSQNLLIHFKQNGIGIVIHKYKLQFNYCLCLKDRSRSLSKIFYFFNLIVIVNIIMTK